MVNASYLPLGEGAQGDMLVAGLEDVSKFPALFAELARRGWQDESLAKLSRHNLMRVFAAVEKSAPTAFSGAVAKRYRRD